MLPNACGRYSVLPELRSRATREIKRSPTHEKFRHFPHLPCRALEAGPELAHAQIVLRADILLAGGETRQAEGRTPNIAVRFEKLLYVYENQTKARFDARRLYPLIGEAS